MSEAFTFLCESLSCNVVLFVPTPSDRFIVYTDASGVGVGACLHADREDGEVPTRDSFVVPRRTTRSPSWRV